MVNAEKEKIVVQVARINKELDRIKPQDDIQYYKGLMNRKNKLLKEILARFE